MTFPKKLKELHLGKKYEKELMYLPENLEILKTISVIFGNDFLPKLKNEVSKTSTTPKSEKKTSIKTKALSSIKSDNLKNMLDNL